MFNIQIYTIYLIPHIIKLSFREVYKFEEYPMQDVELVEEYFSHPPLNDDVSDDPFYDFSDSNIEDEYDDMNAYMTHI